MGDVHGAALAVEQALERANYDPAGDRLIFLGDVADGWPDVRRAVDLFTALDDFVALRGNHDLWFRDWILGTFDPWDSQLWLGQGGYATLDSYDLPFRPYPPARFPESHRDYFRDARLYHEQDGMLFVHGGFIPGVPLDAQDEHVLCWDRDLWKDARRLHRRAQLKEEEPPAFPGEYRKVFVGHTVTTRLPEGDRPVRFCNVWNLDQGAGWEGRLSIMDADTEEFWQSDRVCELYPDAPGRRV